MPPASSFNAESEKCDGAFCDGMSVTMEGGICVTLAYSKHPGNMIATPQDDVCHSLTFVNDLNNDFLGTKKIAALKKSLAELDAARNTTTNMTRVESTPVTATEGMWRQIIGMIKETDFWAKAERELGPYDGESSIKAASKGEDYHTNHDDDEHHSYAHEERLYGGLAVVFTGETTVSSKRGGLKLEETGHVEYAPVFFAWVKDTPRKYEYPLVKGGSMELSFRAEEEQHAYHQHDADDAPSKQYEQHGYYDHEGDDDHEEHEEDLHRH